MQSLHFSCKKYSCRLPVPVLAVALLLLVSLATTASSCTEQEKASLLQFLAGLSQDSGLAKSWHEDGDCCEWEGVTCNRNKTVIEVSLPSRGLEGRITPSLGNLAGLEHLNLSYDSLSDGLPLELLSSSSIVALDVSFNQLSGDLHELPSSTHSQSLQVLNISSNLFMGQFSSTTWKGMQNLIALNASNNSFTGQIPSHFCNISPSHTVLELSYNELSGSIPPGLGNCSMLRVLKADHNNLSGTLPNELFNITSLECLSFSSNGLQGMLDGNHIVKLSNLVILDLGENNFTGKIPDSIGQLRRLQEIHLDHNSMSGELPSTLSNCTDLIMINLRINTFTGELAKVLNGSKDLTTLLIGVNFMNEAIPYDDSIDGFENLKVLDIGECQLSGTIPVWISRLVNLEVLALNGNRLSGPIPTWINTLNYLFLLDISNNSLTGEIPKELMNMPMLISEKTAAHLGPRIFDLPVYDGPTRKYRVPISFPSALQLGNNKFTGVIPPEIGQLKALLSLGVISNNLTGPIPPSICNLTNLLVLDLSNNNLTGKIPAALENLHFLSAFNVSNNNLEGPIPTGGQFNTFLNSSFDGNPKLCGPMINRNCSSGEAGPVSIVYKKSCGGKVIFALAIVVFFGVGVLYDQMVLSRCFG
ncbi:hypothetical protein BS78_06G025700 [Paspalum vaginatum]|nr:hypothetical protein BS78_06G025700 [Paspalum vaginatum]